MEVYFIRHGMTRGNQEQRYVGCTDEEILPMEKERLKILGQRLPAMDYLFISPMLRCRQSAAALFPAHEADMEVIEDLKEIDFGAFEYKNHLELNGDLDYQSFIDTNGASGFPGGEGIEKFKLRCIDAFAGCMKRAQKEECSTVGCVVHGGTIMAIMEAFALPQKSYYEYQVKNGCGYLAVVSEGLYPDSVSLRIQSEIGGNL